MLYSDIILQNGKEKRYQEKVQIQLKEHRKKDPSHTSLKKKLFPEVI